MINTTLHQCNDTINTLNPTSFKLTPLLIMKRLRAAWRFCGFAHGCQTASASAKPSRLMRDRPSTTTATTSASYAHTRNSHRFNAMLLFRLTWQPLINCKLLTLLNVLYVCTATELIYCNYCAQWLSPQFLILKLY